MITGQIGGGRTLWQVVKGVEIREPRGDLFPFVWDLLPAALLTSWTQELGSERAQAGDGVGAFVKPETGVRLIFKHGLWRLSAGSSLADEWLSGTFPKT